MSDSLLLEIDGNIATITLNRPDSLNSLNNELKVALAEALATVTADERVRAVVLAGAGRAFCVGQDLREHVGALGDSAPLNTVVQHYNPIAVAIAELPKPVVAAVRGSAAGAGASLALLADFRIGGPGTSFLMAFAKVGLAGDTGISWTLPRIVGHAKATELLILAEPVKADEALRLGLLTRLTDDDDQVLATAQELAGKLAAGPTVAFGQIKRELLHGTRSTLSQALAIEAEAQAACGATNDHPAATMAFVNKEKPVFQGN
ncbi:MAG TPA: enoyl-CoA hydratase [Micromonosporaceae bacterium]|nr:enoyl-CoA hydratase [Micromonosporaceae bacterium]